MTIIDPTIPVPEWNLFDDCPVCDAPQGHACIDMRQGKWRRDMYPIVTPHPSRPHIAPSDRVYTSGRDEYVLLEVRWRRADQSPETIGRLVMAALNEHEVSVTAHAVTSTRAVVLP